MCSSRFCVSKASSGKEAKALGEPRYFTGKPCVRGHVAERYTYNGMCIACNSENSVVHRKLPVSKVRQRGYYERLRREAPEVIAWRSARLRARREAVPFDIEPSDIKAVWPADGKCPALGIALRHNFDGTGGNAAHSPSLDKVIPSLGYVKGNIVVISQKANRLKCDETDPATFRRLADWLERVKGG